MKKSKKLKLITTLSSVGITATAASLVATACASVAPTLGDLSANPANGKDISKLNWFKRTKFNTNVLSEIQNIVFDDNEALFRKYPGLEQAITLTTDPATITSSFKITITASGSTYTGKAEWNATYATAADTVDIDVTVPYTLDVSMSKVWYPLTATLHTAGTEVNLKSANVTIAAGSSNNDIFVAEWDKVSYPDNPQLAITPKGEGTATLRIVITDNDVTPTAVGEFSQTITVKASTIANKTWQELKTLKDTSTLVPGQLYRLTDFNTTVNTGTVDDQGPYWEIAAAANHQFDLLLTATSNKSLSENVTVLNHEDSNEDYFKDAELSAWTVKYCLENNTNRFDWAVDDDNVGRGVIYYMKDEFGNEASYDFKNILFTPFNESGTPSKYTFDNNGADASLNGRTNKVYNNTIGAYSIDGVLALNGIVFEGTGAYNNDFSEDCRDMVFGKNCFSNNFKDTCYNNVFGDNCSGNNIGNYFQTNEFGNFFKDNTFGNDCHNITIYNAATTSATSPKLTNNTFGDGITKITVKDGVTFAYNGIYATTSMTSPIEISVNITNKFIINGNIVDPEESYEIADVTFDGTLNKESTITSDALKLTSWYGEVKNVTWQIDETATTSWVTANIITNEANEKVLQVTPHGTGSVSVVVQAYLPGASEPIATKAFTGTAAGYTLDLDFDDSVPNIGQSVTADCVFCDESGSRIYNDTLYSFEAGTDSRLHAAMIEDDEGYFTMAPSATDITKEDHVLPMVIKIVKESDPSYVYLVKTINVDVHNYVISDVAWHDAATGDPISVPHTNQFCYADLTLSDWDDTVTDTLQWAVDTGVTTAELNADIDSRQEGEVTVPVVTVEPTSTITNAKLKVSAFDSTGEATLASKTITFDVLEGYVISGLTWDVTPEAQTLSSSASLSLSYEGQTISSNRVKYEIDTNSTSTDLGAIISGDKVRIYPTAAAVGASNTLTINAYVDNGTDPVASKTIENISVKATDKVTITGSHNLNFVYSSGVTPTTANEVYSVSDINGINDINDITHEIVPKGAASGTTVSGVTSVTDGSNIKVVADSTQMEDLTQKLEVQLLVKKNDTETRFDIEVAPSGLNKIVYNDGETKTVTLPDNYTIEYGKELSGDGAATTSVDFTDIGGSTQSIANNKVESIKLISISPSLTIVTNNFIDYYTGLTNLDLSGFKNITQTYQTFLCHSGKAGTGISNFDFSWLSNIQQTSHWFCGQTNFASTQVIDLRSWTSYRQHGNSTVGGGFFYGTTPTMILPQPKNGKIATFTNATSLTLSSPEIYCGDYKAAYSTAKCWSSKASVMKDGFPSTFNTQSNNNSVTEQPKVTTKKEI